MTNPISNRQIESRVIEVGNTTNLHKDLAYLVVGCSPASEIGEYEGNPRLWQHRLNISPISPLAPIYASKRNSRTESFAIRETHKQAVKEIQDWMPLIQKELENHPNKKLAEALEHPLIDLRQSEIEAFFKIIPQIKDQILIHFFTKWSQWAAEQVPTLENKTQLEGVQKKVEELKDLTQEDKARHLREWLQDDTLPILQLETLPFDPENLLIPPEIIHFKKLGNEAFLDLLSQQVNKRHTETVKAMLQLDKGKQISPQNLASLFSSACLNNAPEQIRLILRLDKEHKLPIVGAESLSNAFFAACGNGHFKIVQAIMNSDRWHDISVEALESSLQRACHNGHVEVVQAIMNSDRWGEFSFSSLRVVYEDAPPQIQTLLRTSPRCLLTAAYIHYPVPFKLLGTGVIYATGLLVSMGYSRYFA